MLKVQWSQGVFLQVCFLPQLQHYCNFQEERTQTNLWAWYMTGECCVITKIVSFCRQSCSTVSMISSPKSSLSLLDKYYPPISIIKRLHCGSNLFLVLFFRHWFQNACSRKTNCMSADYILTYEQCETNFSLPLLTVNSVCTKLYLAESRTLPCIT